MSSFNTPRYLTGKKAGADLSAKQYCAVKIDTDGDVILCGAGERACGFLMNAPQENEFCEIAAIGGGALAISAATIAANTPCKADANGHLVAADTDGDKVIAITQFSSVDNDVFEVMPVMFDLYVAP